MKLIRWLMSNIFLIVIVLAACYAYVYWDNLTGKDTPAGSAIAWMSEEFDDFDELMAYISVSTDSEPETPSENKSRVSPAPAKEATLSPGDIKKYAIPVTREPAPAPAPAPQEPPSQESVPQPDVVHDKFITPELEQSLTKASSEDAAAEPSTSRELWIQARQSFYRRDFESSVSNYEQLISKDGDNFDAYGELGNVYFNQGKMKEAAASYFKAAEVLVRFGQVKRASSLLVMLKQMDVEKAQELQSLIAGAQSH